jgi:hypothetical protein
MKPKSKPTSKRKDLVLRDLKPKKDTKGARGWSGGVRVAAADLGGDN